MKKILINVDMQYDFLEAYGRLTVFPDPISIEREILKSNIYRLKSKHTANIKDNETEDLWVNTLDFHQLTDIELSDSPDFQKTFPRHCIAGSWGAESVTGLKATDPDFFHHYILSQSLASVSLKSTTNELVFTKDMFSVWLGNFNFKNVMESVVEPDDVIYIFGVTTQICVHAAIEGFKKYFSGDNKIVVLEDCIAPIDGMPVEPIYEQWKKWNVEFMNSNDIR